MMQDPDNKKLNTDNFDTVTVFDDSVNNDPALSPEELRSCYDIMSADDFRNYGKLRLIGMGGMGMVFQARDPGLQRKVALKILRSDFRNRSASVKKFVREARMTARIDHPNIVPVHQMGVLENIGVYFTMKHIHGENLREIFDKLSSGNEKAKQLYTLRRLLDIFISACNGVTAAHASGVLHCDLKPGNIMIGKFGEVLVLDWGVARENIPAGPMRPGEKPFTDEDSAVEGTPVFMAPELLCGEITHPDEQTDVYGMGAILYTILTLGKLPFDVTEGSEAVLKKVVNGEIIPIKNHLSKKDVYHRELAAICYKAMARDRIDRYTGVEALREDIYNYLNGYPVTACSPNLWNRFIKLIRRRPLIPSVLLAIALSMGTYHGFTELQDLANDNALKEIIADNSKIANSNRRLAIRRMNMLDNPKLSDESRAAIQRNLMVAVVNATVEYNMVFDAASRLKKHNQEQFLRSGGTAMFSRVLRMNWRMNNRGMIKEFFVRCRGQWSQLFTMACRFDPELKELVDHINEQMKPRLLSFHEKRK